MLDGSPDLSHLEIEGFYIDMKNSSIDLWGKEEFLLPVSLLMQLKFCLIWMIDVCLKSRQ